MTRPRVLLLEDDTQLTNKLLHIFKEEFEIDAVTTSSEAIGLLSNATYDLYVFDIVLSDRDSTTGLEVCERVRKADKNTPILMISGKNALHYILGAFKLEANDYLCKPFNALELKARMYALLRSSAVQGETLTAANLQLNRITMKVTRDNKNIHLRRKEFKLLELMLMNKGRVLTRELLAHKTWKNGRDIESNTIDVHIKNLRAKIDRPFEKKLIKTVYGVGYKVEE